MKFEYLREFACAARSSEMQKCADKLGLSPSVLSKHMKTLSQELGVPLFLRSRKIELSQFGKLLLPYAEALTSLQDEYLKDFAAPSSDPDERLTVALSPIQSRERAGRILTQFAQNRAPGRVIIREGDNASLISLLKSGGCDMAFVRTQQVLDRDPELVYMPFCSDPMVAFLPPDHPLAGAEAISLEELSREHILLRSENSGIYRTFTARCAQCGITPNISFASTYVIYDMIRRHEGVTLYLARPVDAARNTQAAIVRVDPPIYSFVDVVFRHRRLPPLGVELLRYIQQSSAQWYTGTSEETYPEHTETQQISED